MKYPKPLTTTVAVLLALPATFAQTPAPEETGPAEAVIITGSNIKRSDYEGPQSVTVFTAEKIAKSGARTVSDLIARLPQNAAGFSNAVNTGLSFSPGAAAASLRGLGASATLVLLNGRRVAPFPLAQEGVEAFTDLNGIPLAAIERIDVLKESASAVYGSDAIAGVINIILKENYSGAETESYYGNTTKNDAAETRQSLTSGISNEKFHLLLNANYYHQNSLADVDRGFSSSADHRRQGGDDLRSSRGNPGTIFTSNGAFAVPRGSNGRLTTGDFLDGSLPDGNLRNRYDFNKDSELIPETERWGGLLTFGYNLTPHLEVFGETSYQSVRTKTRVAPTPPDSAGDGFVVPANNPFNPFGEDVAFLWRSVETGPRRNIIESDAYRYLGGLRIKDLPHNWSAEIAGLYSEVNVVDYSRRGYLSVAKVQDALNQTDPDKALNVFGAGRGINPGAVLDPLIAHPRNDGLSYIYGVDAKASGDLFPLPAGAVKLAVGGEYREEFSEQQFSAPIGSIVGSGGAGSGGDRDVRALYYEVSIPLASEKWNTYLLRKLEFTIAQRYDDYSDFGNVVKPKFGFAWKPISSLLLRGAYSEGFRAPSLPQLFSGTVSSFATVVNPRTGITTDVPITTGGNPALMPETSYSYFLGGVYDPPFIKGLSLGVHLFRIEQRNLVDQPSPNDILNGRSPGLVSYNANNEITSISALYTNLGTVVTDGVDIELDYEWETRFGNFTFEHRSTFMNSYEQKEPGKDNEDLTDSFQLPEFKMANSLFYSLGGFEAGVTVNYTDSYDDIVYDEALPTRKVGSFTTVDLQASYSWDYEAKETAGGLAKDGKTALESKTAGLDWWQKWLNGTKLTIGCTNVGDSEPPFSNIEEGYDTATADATGRFVYASLKKKFW